MEIIMNHELCSKDQIWLINAGDTLKISQDVSGHVEGGWSNVSGGKIWTAEKDMYLTIEWEDGQYGKRARWVRTERLADPRDDRDSLTLEVRKFPRLRSAIGNLEYNDSLQYAKYHVYVWGGWPPVSFSKTEICIQDFSISGAHFFIVPRSETSKIINYVPPVPKVTKSPDTSITTYKGFKICKTSEDDIPIFEIYTEEDWGYGEELRSREWGARTMQEAHDYVNSNLGLPAI